MKIQGKCPDSKLDSYSAFRQSFCNTVLSAWFCLKAITFLKSGIIEHCQVKLFQILRKITEASKSKMQSETNFQEIFGIKSLYYKY